MTTATTTYSTDREADAVPLSFGSSCLSGTGGEETVGCLTRQPARSVQPTWKMRRVDWSDAMRRHEEYHGWRRGKVGDWVLHEQGA